MKSDLVAQLDILGNYCNSSKSNMATQVEGKSKRFFKDKARLMCNTMFSYKSDLRNSFLTLFPLSEVNVKVKCHLYVY